VPYIKAEKRPRFDGLLDWAVKLLSEIPEEDRDGYVNYFVTVLLKRLYQPPKYRRYNKAIGVLECIKLEFYRRDVAPYEDKKIEENGDVK